MNRRSLIPLRSFSTASFFGVALLTIGCHLAVDPFTDDLEGEPAVTTPSVIAVRSVKGEPTRPQRSYARMSLTAKDGTVTHGPLYFEDAFEDASGEDDSFAWTGEDYLAWFGGGGRFLINTALFPLSAAVTPPWVVMTSDGQPGRRVLGLEAHDAVRGAHGHAHSPPAGRSATEAVPPDEPPVEPPVQDDALSDQSTESSN